MDIEYFYKNEKLGDLTKLENKINHLVNNKEGEFRTLNIKALGAGKEKTLFIYCFNIDHNQVKEIMDNINIKITYQDLYNQTHEFIKDKI